LKWILILSKLQLQKFHKNLPCFKSPFICFKHSKKACGQMVYLFQKSFFPYQMFTKSFHFFPNFNIFHKKGNDMFKTFKKLKYIYTFRFCYLNILKHYYHFEFVIMVQSKVIDLTIIQSLMQKKLRFFHVICHIWLQIWYYVWKTLWEMRYKPIENCHMEDAVLRKDFNLDTIGSLFCAFTHVPFLVHLSAHSPSSS